MYTAMIRKNSTGEIRPYLMPDDYWDESERYLWTDGNFGCDCNRAMFFAHAGNEKPNDTQHCGDDVAYSVPYIKLLEGTLIDLSDD